MAPRTTVVAGVALTAYTSVEVLVGHFGYGHCVESQRGTAAALVFRRSDPFHPVSRQVQGMVQGDDSRRVVTIVIGEQDIQRRWLAAGLGAQRHRSGEHEPCDGEQPCETPRSGTGFSIPVSPVAWLRLQTLVKVLAVQTWDSLMVSRSSVS